MSTFVLIDCCDYMVLDFRQQLKNALKDVKCLGDLNGSGAGWGGGVGGIHSFTSGIEHRVSQEKYYTALLL